ncbi:NAD(P) transhydrogenase subunit alpha [Luteibacter aegosomatis]|uniref:NAD(P) transhydrogenase subunit alpha n=1 Tax=Luteibacter aegosomatis TaxID=2911537 RepID=UPI001FFA90EF|nr:NAD(P) transhydrogenase subunit alpha [Luteibacter aegosomatis]UPG86135.1 NAD(P) transhydrogenase subunit alpha [Luteibacter aegosomatis]
MSIKIAVLRETDADERRVAIVPSTLSGLTKLGASVAIQAGAGLGAHYADADYADATIANDPVAMVTDADVVLAVQPPPSDVVAAMRPGAALVSFVYANREPALVEQLRDRRISTFAMEKVPRISRAQAMDALSSQAALAGYYAPLLGAVHLPRILPMMTTAVGSLRAARVLVMGLGVAGLQALTTAHRLGAITEGYDVRPETREQAQSVGAKFVDTGVDARGEGGYARALTAEEQAKAHEVLTRHIQQADLIVTTASVPGRAAPRLIDHAQIAGMKPGSVIVDLAADGGCNCEGAVPGQTVRVGPVTILAPPNVPSLLAQHASELYAKNVFHLLGLILKDGTVSLDLDDAVIAGTLLTHAGEIRHVGAMGDAEASSRSPAVAEMQT